MAILLRDLLEGPSNRVCICLVIVPVANVNLARLAHDDGPFAALDYKRLAFRSHMEPSCPGDRLNLIPRQSIKKGCEFVIGCLYVRVRPSCHANLPSRT